MAGKSVPLVVRTIVVTELIALLLAVIATVLARSPVEVPRLATMFIEDPPFIIELGITFGIVSTFLSGFALAFLASRGFGKVDRRQ